MVASNSITCRLQLASSFPIQASDRSGFFGSCKDGEDSLKINLPSANADHVKLCPSQMEHKQPAYISYSLTDSLHNRIFSAREPNYGVSPQVMGFTPPRAVVPLDCTKGMPVYVNAKQYHAIVKRRQTRAKLEAQNKLTRSRKPYLHESRHLHALKRSRGSSGRFLNTKSMKESKTRPSESNSWVASTTSISVSFKGDDGIFRQACYSLVEAPLLLAVDTYSRISNTADCVV